MGKIDPRLLVPSVGLYVLKFVQKISDINSFLWKCDNADE